MIVGIRVIAENIRTGNVKHCNSSYFTMVAKNDDDESVAVPGLILNNEIEIRRFLKSINLIKLKKYRHPDFKDKTFTPENYLPILESYKVKVDL
jgi:acyl-CoA hydrolase